MKKIYGDIFKSIILIISFILTILFLSFSDYIVNAYYNVIIGEKFWHYNVLFTSIIICSILFLVLFLRQNKAKLYIILFLFLIIVILAELIILLLNNVNLVEIFSNIDFLIGYIKSFGKLSAVLFIVIQFLQVVILPIPSIITVTAGVLIFGPFLCSVYSLIGIVFGSVTAFIIGRKFGIKFLYKLFGKNKVDKITKSMAGKDKLFLVIMYLFPLFPDDLMCFIAGISSFTLLQFSVCITVVRIITVFISCYSINNSFIPYDTWWGILIWILIFASFFTAYLIIKNKNKKYKQ